MLYYLYTAISSARLSLCKLYSLYAESPMRAPGHNALVIRFFDFGVIYIVCLFLSYASPLVLFSSLFPYLSLFLLRIDPLHFQARCRKRRLNLALVFLCLFCVVVYFF